MKTIFICITLTAASLLLGCAGNADNLVGVQCDYRDGKPLWEMPLVCQGR